MAPSREPKAFHFYSAPASAAMCVFSCGKDAATIVPLDTSEVKSLQEEAEHIEHFVADFHVA